MHRSNEKEDLSLIRRKAEKKLLEQSKLIEELSVFDLKYLVNELGTHQIELEMQNEELRRTQKELEVSQSRYQELYDLAPVGYFAFDEKGFIREVNLTGASMLGTERGLLIGKRIYQFVDSSDQDTFYLYLRSIFKLKAKETLEIKLKRADGSIFYAQMESASMGTDYCNSILSDITRRKSTEMELQISTRQLHQLTAHLQSVREEERTNIARDIHDDLGQAMTALKMDLSEMEEQLLTNRGIEKLAELVKADLEIVKASIQSVQRICTQLRPNLLEHFGLGAALEWQAEEFQKRYGIECKVNLIPADIIVDEEYSTVLFRIFQEALTNVQRHAKATKITTSLSDQGDSTILQIADNGVGIDKENLSKSNSFGLMGMRERVQILNGELRITGSQKTGTTITVIIPKNKEEQSLKPAG